ncbi:hypothetical protein BN946_scf184908.g102 [Trametes cinnabarina]|uniref:HMA domain-containing protein n=1 Tax=Pycnoporus cinnabarinus TaxID=5643 RepID=A0A060SGJ8_PYCCI|nr:hypothetical protein BN946_scf184908.g102 [Trametes cinnabarina]
MTFVSASQTLPYLRRADDATVKDMGDLPSLDALAVTPSGLQKDSHETEQASQKNEEKSSSNEYHQHAECPCRVDLSVDGMTCASCINTITALLSDIPGVSNIVVSLLSKSATAVVHSRDLVPQLTEAIDDAGYEAVVVSIQPAQIEASNVQDTAVRTLSFRVEGMSTHDCPEKVLTALEAFGSQLAVEEPIFSYTNPILTISYTPRQPDLTVRSIISAIQNAEGMGGTGRLAVTIHRPLSLEDRARSMQRGEQGNLLLRFVSSAVVAIPTFVIGVVYASLVPSSSSTRRWLEAPIWRGNASRVQWALFILATPVMFYSAGMFHRRCLKELYALWRKGSRVPLKRSYDALTQTPVGLRYSQVSSGVSVAYFASIALLVLAALQNPSPSGRGDTTTYFDSVVFLTTFLLAGRFLEAISKSRAADAITALGELHPACALLVVSQESASPSLAALPALHSKDSDSDAQRMEEGDVVEKFDSMVKDGATVVKIDAELLEVGDLVRVLHGASPPADGTVVAGDCGAFDESSLTGESRLVKKSVGDKVFVGTISKAGVVDIRVDKIGGQTMLDHIVQVVREGQTRRAPIERVADIITGYFVPVVTLLASVTWIIWLSLGFGGALPPDYLDIEVGGWAVWSLEFAIAVFVVACPCGIALAAPTALLVGSGLAAQHGILARGGGEAFQETAQLDLIVFDKTGTLTEGGNPKVTDVQLFSDQSTDRRLSSQAVLGMAMELETGSSHPLATAIRRYCTDSGGTPCSAASVHETPGRGIRGSFNSLGYEVALGNEAWIEAHEVQVDGKVSALLNTWKAEGKSVAILAAWPTDLGLANSPAHCAVLAAFAIADPVRPEAKEVVMQLQAQGLGTWMISGDNVMTAKAVASSKVQWLQQVGMKRPAGSFTRIFGRRGVNSERCVVAMVGDGINDAPALTVADVGIAIGSGSDVAIASASFILVSSNLRSLLILCDLSRTVFNRVKFNFFWASVYNLVALPVAAGVIYPAGHARLPPVWASLAMALSSVSVVCSSLLLRLYREPKISS